MSETSPILADLHARAKEWPRSHPEYARSRHVFERYKKQLELRSPQTCVRESNHLHASAPVVHDETPSVHFLEITNDAARSSRKTEITSENAMVRHLSATDPFNDQSIAWRLVAIHAADSRSKLRMTKAMLQMLLLRHHITPNFLDYVFPFKEQVGQSDFHYSGFSAQTHHFKNARLEPCAIVQQHFSLKSVEFDADLPGYTIRQASFHHSLNLDTGHTLWVVVKADLDLAGRLRDSAQSEAFPLDCRSGEARLESSYKASLETHRLNCHWAVENWRWYVEQLEESVDRTADEVVNVGMDREPSPMPRYEERRAAWKDAGSGGNKFRLWQHLPGMPSPPPTPPASSPPVSPMEKSPPPLPRSNGKSFAFGDLQDAQQIERKINLALSVLASNIKVMQSMLLFYRSLNDMCTARQLKCLYDAHEKNFPAFSDEINYIIAELQTSYDRLQVAKETMQSSRSMLKDALEFEHMVANLDLARKTHVSSEHMYWMSEYMQETASFTERETMSMKAIALVTLIFLPPTFICTLMGTEIRKFGNDKGFSTQALRFFLYTALPLIALVLVLWWIWNIKAKQQVERRKRQWMQRMNDIDDIEQGHAEKRQVQAAWTG